jgi:hypothetical protein
VSLSGNTAFRGRQRKGPDQRMAGGLCAAMVLWRLSPPQIPTGVGGRWLNQPTRLNAPARAFLSPLAEGPYRLSQLTHFLNKKYQKTKLSHA